MLDKIKKFSLIVLLCFLTIALAGCSEEKTSHNSNTTTTESNKTLTLEEIQNNIKTEVVGITEAGDYAIKLSNENDIQVYIEDVIVKFFDEEGNFAKKESTYDNFFCIPANGEIITYIWGYEQDFGQYAKSEIDVTFLEPFYEYFTENFEIKSNDTGEQIAITVVNNNNSDLDFISVNIAFFRDGQVIGIENGISWEEGIEANGGTAYINVPYPQNDDYEDVSYDDFQVYLISAYKE